ncbi:DUF1367 family protein [Providencia rettgeri]|uniref:DUF1367 family protein n=1 Tax=Providencia rettgeri TaxID=587 RepID=UPI002551D773|nr:DUF1367 family protein [Providencia rettgeri]MDK7746591.1 DUF1367 family protein [Providencia rettgeri]MDK7759464.1 DUF1367 family protein [Providencia rettgeri]
MEIEMVKCANGIFAPAFEHDLPRLTKFKNGEMYSLNIKVSRNPAFHRKMFAFFKFCFEHWCADNAGLDCMDEASQFLEFRQNLTILAGFYYTVTTIKGEVRVRAKSLAYANMDSDEFERCYKAMINAAIKHIFRGCNEITENRLLTFF